MALLASCYCCTLSVCCGVLGVYLLVAYVISFSIELWWILEAQETLPAAVFILCIGYFALLLFSSLLLHGLSVKKSTYLLVWMFLMGILLGPEAGLVLYLSIHHWRITTLYGLVEITCWTCRLLVNATAMICVQSLYSTWREEKSLMLRLQALKMSPVPTYQRDRLSSIKHQSRHDYTNEGYQPDERKPHGLIQNYPDTNNIFLDPFFVAPMESLSEFNASSFDANVIDARVQFSPKSETTSQSLLDFRDDDCNNTETPKNNSKNKSISLNYINYLGKKDVKPEDVSTQSLDRRLTKNGKNLKILKSFSPFLNRKNYDEVNVYQIHPPKVIEATAQNLPQPSTQLDSQLNRVYSNRGMYAFDENSKKLIYYPPEFFNRNSRKNRPSIEEESEDFSQLCDVAL